MILQRSWWVSFANITIYAQLPTGFFSRVPSFFRTKFRLQARSSSSRTFAHVRLRSQDLPTLTQKCESTKEHQKENCLLESTTNHGVQHHLPIKSPFKSLWSPILGSNRVEKPWNLQSGAVCSIPFRSHSGCCEVVDLAKLVPWTRWPGTRWSSSFFDFVWNGEITLVTRVLFTNKGITTSSFWSY